MPSLDSVFVPYRDPRGTMKSKLFFCVLLISTAQAFAQGDVLVETGGGISLEVNNTNSNTGIAVTNAGTGITVNNAAVGMEVNSSSTGIQIYSVETGVSAYATSGYVSRGLFGSASYGAGYSAGAELQANGDQYSNNYGVQAYASGGDYSYNVGVYSSAYGGSGSTNYAGYFDGEIVVTSCSGCSPSDQKLKKNIQALSGGIDKVMALKPKTYDMRADEFKNSITLSKDHQYGLIAQEVETVLPDLVKEITAPLRLTEAEKKAKVKKDAFKYKTVNYSALIPIMLKAIQEQQAEIEALKKQLGQSAR
jgi:hypothetical protein